MTRQPDPTLLLEYCNQRMRAATAAALAHSSLSIEQGERCGLTPVLQRVSEPLAVMTTVMGLDDYRRRKRAECWVRSNIHYTTPSPAYTNGNTNGLRVATVAIVSLLGSFSGSLALVVMHVKGPVQ